MHLHQSFTLSSVTEAEFQGPRDRQGQDEDKEGGVRMVVVLSKYLPYNEEISTTDIRKVISHCKSQNLELTIGCDANVHHEAWGSTNIND